MGDVIVVQGVGKRFYRYHADRPVTLKSALMRGLRGMKPVEHFWALQDVTFAVNSGAMVGIMGRNGAGKSTLLRVIGGVIRPDEGRAQIQGRIGALVDLGVGFHPDLTGRQNVFVSGVIAGLTRHDVSRRFDTIVAFAELEDFIESPLRTYSTGMQMRLAFAIAAHTDPDILLIDEVLTVGDISFQQKCLERIDKLKSRGCTILLVSHDPTQVRQLCDEALWLRGGRLVAYGHPEVIVDQYVAEMSAETRRRTPAPQHVVPTPAGTALRVNENRFGSLEVEISAVRLNDGEGFPVSELESGDALVVEIEYFSPQPIVAPIFGVTITRADELICYDTTTEAAGLTLPVLQGHGRIALHLDRLDLGGGKYYVDVGVYERNWSYAYDYHWHVYPFLVRSTETEKGVMRPPQHWKVYGLDIHSAVPLLKGNI